MGFSQTGRVRFAWDAPTCFEETWRLWLNHFWLQKTYAIWQTCWSTPPVERFEEKCSHVEIFRKGKFFVHNCSLQMLVKRFTWDSDAVSRRAKRKGFGNIASKSAAFAPWNDGIRSWLGRWRGKFVLFGRRRHILKRRAKFLQVTCVEVFQKSGEFFFNRPWTERSWTAVVRELRTLWTQLVL